VRNRGYFFLWIKKYLTIFEVLPNATQTSKRDANTEEERLWTRDTYECKKFMHSLSVKIKEREKGRIMSSEKVLEKIFAYRQNQDPSKEPKKRMSDEEKGSANIEYYVF